MKKSMWFIILIATAAITGWADEVIYKHFEEEIRATPPARLTAIVGEADLKLRVQPNLQAAILVSLKKSAQVTIDYRTFAEQDIFGRRSYWFYCAAAQDLKGWAFGFFLDFDKTKVEQIPIIYDAELFVRPQGKPKPLDANKPPLPLMNGPGMVIKTAPLFIDADGRIKIRNLPVYTEIEYFPVFINQLNPKGLVKIKVKVTGETGYIDLKSGADFPIALDFPEPGLEDSTLIPTYSKPDKSTVTEKLFSFGTMSPNQLTGITKDSSGFFWLKVKQAGEEIEYWIPAVHHRFHWRYTLTMRVLKRFINLMPRVTASAAEVINIFGAPDAWYIQKVDIIQNGGSDWVHYLFYKGISFLLIQNGDPGEKWWVAEFFLWDNTCRLNLGLEFGQPESALQVVFENPTHLVIDLAGYGQTGQGYITFYYSAGKKLNAIHFDAGLEMYWYRKIVFLDGFSETKIPLWFQDVDSKDQPTSIVKFGG